MAMQGQFQSDCVLRAHECIKEWKLNLNEMKVNLAALTLAYKMLFSSLMSFNLAFALQGKPLIYFPERPSQYAPVHEVETDKTI